MNLSFAGPPLSIPTDPGWYYKEYGPFLHLGMLRDTQSEADISPRQSVPPPLQIFTPQAQDRPTKTDPAQTRAELDTQTSEHVRTPGVQTPQTLSDHRHTPKRGSSLTRQVSGDSVAFSRRPGPGVLHTCLVWDSGDPTLKVGDFLTAQGGLLLLLRAREGWRLVSLPTSHPLQP